MNKIVLFLLLIPCWTFSQDPSQSDQNNLCKYIILAQSVQPTNQDSVIKKLLSENDITVSRYAEILRAGFEGKPLKLNDNEKKLTRAIQLVNLEARKEEQKKIKIFLLEVGWSEEKLNVLLKKYNENQAFRENINSLITQNNE